MDDNFEYRGNPNGMRTIAKFSRCPVERIRYVADADVSLIDEIERGILFVMAFWSGTSVQAFAEMTKILQRLAPDGALEFVVIDIDGGESIRKHPAFEGILRGVGEAAWIRNGTILRTSGLGFRPEYFEPNTRELLATP